MYIVKKELKLLEVILTMTPAEYQDIKSVLIWANSDSGINARLNWNQDFKDRLSNLYKDILYVD